MNDHYRIEGWTGSSWRLLGIVSSVPLRLQQALSEHLVTYKKVRAVDDEERLIDLMTR
jgi:hypothetical protein